MKRVLPFILASSIIICGMEIPFTAFAEDDRIEIQAESYSELINNDSVYPPNATDTTVQLWEKSGVEYKIDAEKAATYEITMNLSVAAEYVDGDQKTSVDVYLDDELVNERVNVTGAIDGDNSYTLFANNSLGFITLNEGENTIRFELPNDWGARSIIIDRFILTTAEMVVCPGSIQAEAFETYNYTKGTEREVTDVAELTSGDGLTIGTGEGVGGVNALIMPPGAYATYKIAVENEGYYKISLVTSVQGNRVGEGASGTAWCDLRLVPNIKVNGTDAYSPVDSYNKGVHTLRASGDGTNAAGQFGPFIENDKVTVYLKKGGNTLQIGFMNGFSVRYCNQPFYFDCFNLSYIGTEKDPTDKPNVQNVNSGEITDVSPSLYDFETSIDVKNSNFEANGDVLTLRKGSTLVYNINTDGGFFKLMSNMLLADESATSQVNISVNGGTYMPTMVEGTSPDWLSAVYKDAKWGILELNDGVNTVAIQVTNDLMFKNLSFCPAGAELPDPVWNSVTVQANEAYDYYVDSTFDEEKVTGTVRPTTGFELSATKAVITRRRDWYKYTVTVPEDGNYLFSLNVALGDRELAPIYAKINGGKAITGMSVKRTYSFDTYLLQDLGVVQLKKGDNDFEYGIDSQSTNFGIFTQYLQFSNIDSFSLLGTRANSRQLEDATNVFRGTDTINMYFNGTIDKETVNNANVKITDDGGNIVPFVYDVNNNIIALKLYQSLNYATNYKIELSDAVKSSHGLSCGGREINFTTGAAEDEDGGADVIDSANMEIMYEDVTITGTVKSSNGLTMGGRAVYASITDPNGSVVADRIEGVSDENGDYTLNYVLENNSVEGEYTVAVTDQYCSNAASDSALYFASNTENDFIVKINAAVDANGVMAVLNEFENRFGYDLDADLAKIADTGKFYAGFAGKEYAKYSEFAADYELFRYAEPIRQYIDNAKLEPVLYSEEACNAIGLSYNDISHISANKNLFMADIIKNRSIVDYREYVDKLKELTNKYLVFEYGVVSPDSNVSNITVKVGQGIEIPVKFSEKQNKVAYASVTLEDMSNSGLFDEIEVSTIDNVTAEKIGSKVEFEYKPSSMGAIDSFGNVSIIAKKAGTFNLKLTGKISYEVAERTFAGIIVKEKSFTVKVTDADSGKGTDGGSGGSSGAPSHGGGSGFSGSGGGSAIAPSNTNSTDKPNTSGNKENSSDDYSFNDILSVGWAKDSIYTLLNDERGIISKSDDNAFRPNNNITREEFIKMVVLMMGVNSESAKSALGDLDSNAWYYSFVASAEKAGLIQGDNEGNFGVGRPVSRQEMAAIISRCLGDILGEADYSELFADDEAIADYARESVYKVKAAEIVNGIGDNLFDPAGSATRAMAAKMICITMELLAGSEA